VLGVFALQEAAVDEPSVVVAIRVPIAIKGWLQEKARQEDRSVNYIARKLFEREMGAQKEKAA